MFYYIFLLLLFSLETLLCCTHTYTKLLQNFILQILTTKRFTVVTAQKLRAKTHMFIKKCGISLYKCRKCYIIYVFVLPSATWWIFRFLPSSVLRLMPMPAYGTGKTSEPWLYTREWPRHMGHAKNFCCIPFQMAGTGITFL